MRLRGSLRSVAQEGGKGRGAIWRKLFFDIMSWLCNGIEYRNPLRVLYIHVGTRLGILEGVSFCREFYWGLHCTLLRAWYLGKLVNASRLLRVDGSLPVVDKNDRRTTASTPEDEAASFLSC